MSRQLSGADASMLWMERPDRPNHIAPIQVYDQQTAPGGAVTFKGILQYLGDRLDRSRAFRERLNPVPFGLDLPYWVDDPSFDLEFHVRHLALPRPGDWRQFCIQVARLHSRPLDLAHPPWELYVIEGLNDIDAVPPGAFATMLKVHHAAVDGVAGVELVTAMHEHEATAEASPSAWTPGRAPNNVELLARAGLNLVTRPTRFPAAVGRYLPSVRTSIARRLPGATGPKPTAGLVAPTRFNGPLTPHRVFEARRFPMADLRRIKATVPGATVNDVVLALVGGSLRRFLLAEGELPEDPLIAAMPISLRTESESGAGGNRITTTFVPVGTDIADPHARLESIYATTSAHKAIRNASSAPSLVEVAENVPGALLGLAMRGVFAVANRRAIAHTCVTNVPGPRSALFFAGARMATTFGMTPLQTGVGLFHAVSSYDDELIVSVTSCRSMLPEPARYAACIDESMADLLT